MKKIAAMTKDYEKQASGQARTMLQIFEITAKRNAASADWSKAFDGLLGSSALASAPNWFEIEKAMYEADTHFNAIRAAAWRFASTGEETQRKAIELPRLIWTVPWRDCAASPATAIFWP